MHPHDPNRPPPPWPPSQAPQQGWPAQGQPGQAQPQPGAAPHPGHAQPQPGAVPPPPGAAPPPGYPPQPGPQPGAAPPPGYPPQPGAAPGPGYHPPQPGYAQPGYQQQQPGPGYVPFHGGAPQPGFHQAQYVHPPQKSGAAGRVLLIIFGALGLFLGFLLWLGLGHEGYGASFGVGIFSALCAFMIAWGSTGAMAGKKKLLVGGIVGALLTVGFGVTGPAVGAKVQRDNEESRWEELEAGVDDVLFDPYLWRIKYEEDTPDAFKREGWQSKWMLARVQFEKRKKNVPGVRGVLRDIAADDGADYSEAKTAASEYLTSVYDEAIAGLKAPAKSDKDAAAVDEKLRGAFIDVLHSFSASPEADLYLAFSQNVDMSPAEGDAEALANIRNSANMKRVFPAGAPIIDQGDAFKAKFDLRRRNMFVRSMTDAFHQVFADELLHIVALEPNEKREGKYVLEVNSQIRRIPFYGSYYTTNDLGQKIYKGLTMEFVVVWSFRLVGPDGKAMYQADELLTEAAPEVSLGNGGPTPVWAIYAALMDSAYYNYSRTVVTRFGLTAPSERTVFPFQAVSAQ